jgi:hypothetical protein
MTRLTYVVTTSKGTCEVTTLARAKELVEMYGGSYKAKYTSVEGV